MIKNLTIKIEYRDDPNLPPEGKFVGLIVEKKGMVESADSVSNVLRELAISVDCWEDYNKQKII